MEVRKKIQFNQVKYQYLTVLGGEPHLLFSFRCYLQTLLLVNIISLCHGFAVGWLSAAVPILKSKGTPLQSGPLTVEQTMWLGGVYPLGGFVGNCVFGVLVNYFGRVASMSLLALPNFVSETIMHFKTFQNSVLYRYSG